MEVEEEDDDWKGHMGLEGKREVVVARGAAGQQRTNNNSGASASARCSPRRLAVAVVLVHA